MADLERGLLIHELTPAPSLSTGNWVAVDNGSNTYKTTIASLTTTASQNAYTYAQNASNSATAAASSATQAQTAAQSVNGAIVQATAQLQGYVNSAAESAASAEASEIHVRALVTSDYAKTAKSYAVGDTGYRPDEDRDNARFYCRTTQEISEETAGYVDEAEGYANTAQAAKTDAVNAKNQAANSYNQILSLLTLATFSVDIDTGLLMYDRNEAYTFNINTTTGNLEWEVVA